MKYVSLFSGIEAASVAWEPLGWKAIAFSEIEKFPCEVLATHYPDVPNLGDISNIDWSDIGAVDLIVGGSPCQAFSVAGKRRGLMDERGRLMLEFVRAVRDIHPRWLLWENVPGVFSQSGGDAFETFQEELEKCGYSLAWRTLDAQFFGVAQRRRRVFLVGHVRAECAAAVLFERESLRWDYPTSKEKRKSLTRDVETGTRENCLNGWDCQSKRVFRHDGLAPTLSAGNHEGVNMAPSICLPFDTTQITSAANGNNPQWGDPCHTLSAGANAPTVITQYGDIAGTLTARFDSSPCPDRGQTIVAYPIAGNIIGRAEENGGHQLGVGSEYDPMFTLDTLGAHGVVCIGDDNAKASVDVDLSGTLKVGGRPPMVADEYTVRRLTPLECERLQGFPDGYTDIYENTPDTPRYKALGNSMAVPVMRWIGERIEKVERLQYKSI